MLFFFTFAAKKGLTRTPAVFGKKVGRHTAKRSVICGQQKNMTAAELLAAYANGQRDFSGVELLGAKLSGADLSGAKLSQANLGGADLEDVNFSGVIGYMTSIRH